MSGQSAVNFGTGAGGSTGDNTDTTVYPSSVFGYSAEEEPVQIPYAPYENYMGPVTAQTRHQVVINGPGGNGDANDTTTHNFGQTMKDFATLHSKNPDQFAQIQQDMYAAGFYNPYLKSGQAPQFGRADDASQKAYHDVVAEASRSGMTPQEVIANAKQTAGQASNGPAPTKLVDPDTFKASVQQAATSVLGTNVGPDLAQRIYDNFEKLQQQNYTNSQGQTQDYSTTGSGDWIKQQLQTLMPNTYQSYQNFQGLSALQNFIGQPVNNLLSGH